MQEADERETPDKIGGADSDNACVCSDLLYMAFVYATLAYQGMVNCSFTEHFLISAAC